VSERAVRPHPGLVRGERRRAELVAAGVALLREVGWAGLTARGVADRAGAQLGLIHYHWGGFPALKRAIAGAVIADAFEPALQRITDAPTWQEGVAAVVMAAAAGSEAGPGDSGAVTERLTGELIAAALQDEDVRTHLRDVLAAARDDVAQRLGRDGVPASVRGGLATALVAMLDGLALHRVIDPDLDLGAVAAAARWLGVTTT
jgi:AcrR family transcriptional regulator